MTFDIQIYVLIVIFSCTGKAISSKEIIVRGKIPTVDPPLFFFYIFIIFYQILYYFYLKEKINLNLLPTMAIIILR